MQLPLPVTLPDDETFDSFIAGNNRQLIALLKCIAHYCPSWRQQPELGMLNAASIPLLNIVGATGKGKSHLLYAVCHQLANRQVPHVYLHCEDLIGLSPRVLDSLEQLPVICLDSLDAICGNEVWEEAIFDLINRVSETRVGLLLFASMNGPQHSEYMLPDLRSRLSGGMTFQLAALDDNERMQVLSVRAIQRGLNLSASALQYLLNHSQRDMTSLMALLDRLDQRSLQEQKKISVAMVKRELSQ